MFSLVLAWCFLIFASLTRAEYSIDDRDSRIQYYGPHWQRFSDSTAYMGTTTDNACVTSDNCYFTVSFTGSGVSLTRFIITSIPIPLEATVTIDGDSHPDISIPDGSPAVTVFDVHGLTYGSHLLRVNFVSYSGGVASHFRLDRAIIDDTQPPTPTPTPTPGTTNFQTPTRSTTTSPSSSTTSIALPGTAQTLNQKSQMPAIVGGTVGAVAFTGILAALFFFLRTRNPRKLDLDTEKIDTQMIYTPFQPQPPSAVNAMASQSHVNNVWPSPAFPPEIQDDTSGTGAGRLQPGTLMSTFPTAADRFAPTTSAVPPLFPVPTVLANMPTRSPQSAPQADAKSSDYQAPSFDPMDSRSLSPSIASSAPLLAQFGPLTDTERTEIAQLIHLGVSVPDAMRILEDKRKMEEGSSVGVGGSSFASTSAQVGGDIKYESFSSPDATDSRPPAYKSEL